MYSSQLVDLLRVLSLVTPGWPSPEITASRDATCGRDSWASESYGGDNAPAESLGHRLGCQLAQRDGSLGDPKVSDPVITHLIS